MSAVESHLELVETPEEKYANLSTYFDDRYNVAWCYMHASPRPCFTRAQLSELYECFVDVKRHNTDPGQTPIEYFVLASDVPGVYSLGGDLDLFKRLIVTRNRDDLFDYAKACIDALYLKMTGFDCDVTHVTLVQGDALGGGFECALAGDVLIAEKGSKFGLPEIMFNLFPGMGAYSILSRKLNPAEAKRIILSGRLYSAEEMHEMGVVDVLAEEFQGEMAVYDYMRRESRSANGIRGLRKAMAAVDPVSHQELMEIAEVWVESALKLGKRDLRMMERLVARQHTKSGGITPGGISQADIAAPELAAL